MGFFPRGGGRLGVAGVRGRAAGGVAVHLGVEVFGGLGPAVAAVAAAALLAAARVAADGVAAILADVDRPAVEIRLVHGLDGGGGVGRGLELDDAEAAAPAVGALHDLG